MNIQSHITHDNIVRLYRCFQNEKLLMLQLEYCPMDLHKYATYQRKKVSFPFLKQFKTLYSVLSDIGAVKRK